jgi:hypothetical protein
VSDELKIGREELATPEVDREVARRRALAGGRPPDPPPLSPLRRLLNSSLFYLPVAAVAGALVSFVVLEPHIHDVAKVGGEIVLVNAEPFAVNRGMRSITVGDAEVLLDERVAYERGPDGELAFTSFSDLQPGRTVEVVGLVSDGEKVLAAAIRPASPEHARRMGGHVVGREFQPALLLLLPLTATLIALGLLLAEGFSTRNWLRMLERSFIGGLLAAVFSALSFIPAGLILAVSNAVFKSEAARSELLVLTAKTISGTTFFVVMVCRSLAWACIGAALGVGMNLVRSTRVQLRNSVLGGALGGALGGLFFDPIDRWLSGSVFAEATASRLVGLVAVGLGVGLFVALVERLAREAWVRVRTGPLAGKSFVLYRTPTKVGSSPQADIYLFKDADIDGVHAQIHRVGNAFEIEDMGTRHGTRVGTQAIQRRRLQSGDQITLGSTVLEFEERARRDTAR